MSYLSELRDTSVGVLRSPNVFRFTFHSGPDPAGLSKKGQAAFITGRSGVDKDQSLASIPLPAHVDQVRLASCCCSAAAVLLTAASMYEANSVLPRSDRIYRPLRRKTPQDKKSCLQKVFFNFLRCFSVCNKSKSKVYLR